MRPGDARKEGLPRPRRPRAALTLAALLLFVGMMEAEPSSGLASVHSPQLAGTLEGTVTLAGDTLPSSTRVLNSTDPEVCGREHDLRDLVVSRESRGVRYVIVSLSGVPEGAVPERTPERLVIDNRDCQFLPHASVVTIGDTVVARNSDPTLHNTHYYGPMRSNIALAEQGMTVARVARRPGLVTVLCDVHGWMTAYLRIDPHPFHAVTDADGRFRIEGVPPGSYTLELWHEKLGTREIDVEVQADGVSSVAVEYEVPSD